VVSGRICLADSLVGFHGEGLFMHCVLCSRRSKFYGFFAVGIVGNGHLHGYLVGILGLLISRLALSYSLQSMPIKGLCS
jgi:hypothetical protein